MLPDDDDTLVIVLDDAPRPAPPSPAASRTMARTHTLKQLRSLCAQRGLYTTGNKHELAARLADAAPLKPHEESARGCAPVPPSA